MFPAGSTSPVTTCAIAASIFDDEFELSDSRFTNCDKFATVVAAVASHFESGVSPASISPGCTIGSPSAAVSLLASTWLLLKMYCVPPRVTSEPSVPPQHVIVCAAALMT